MYTQPVPDADGEGLTITIDSLLSRPKLDCDVGYNVVVKGASVVVYQED